MLTEGKARFSKGATERTNKAESEQPFPLLHNTALVYFRVLPEAGSVDIISSRALDSSVRVASVLSQVASSAAPASTSQMLLVAPRSLPLCGPVAGPAGSEVPLSLVPHRPPQPSICGQRYARRPGAFGDGHRRPQDGIDAGLAWQHREALGHGGPGSRDGAGRPDGRVAGQPLVLEKVLPSDAFLPHRRGVDLAPSRWCLREQVGNRDRPARGHRLPGIRAAVCVLGPVLGTHRARTLENSPPSGRDYYPPGEEMSAKADWPELPAARNRGSPVLRGAEGQQSCRRRNGREIICEPWEKK